MTLGTEPRPGPELAAIPRTMRALRKASAGLGFTLEQVPVPAIGPNDVLIAVKTVGLCGTDLHIYSWDHWAQRRVKPPLTIPTRPASG